MTMISRAADTYALPPGTRINNNAQNSTRFAFYIDDYGTIHAPGGDWYQPSAVIGHTAHLPEDPPERRRLTFEEFRQRVATVSRGCAYASSVSVTPVEDILREVDCDFAGTAEPGWFVHQHDRQITPPEGHALVAGHLGDWSQVVVYDHEWRKIFGGLRRALIARVDGVPYSTPTDEDARLIRQLKVRLWDLGQQAQSQEQWCSAFERAMGLLRIDENVTREPDPLTVPEAVPMVERVNIGTNVGWPLGMILMFDNHENPYEGRWNWVVQDNSTYGTRYLLGPNHGSHGGQGPVIFNPEDGPMFIPLPGNRNHARTLLVYLPVGTHLATGDRNRAMADEPSGHLYKWPNGTWGYSEVATMSAENILDSFPNLHIIEIPGVPGCEPSNGPAALVSLL